MSRLGAALALALSLVGCGPAKGSESARASGSASGSAPITESAPSSSAVSAVAPCPPIDDAALEPARRVLPATTFTLGELFPHDQPVRREAPFKMNVGTIGYATNTGSIGHGYGSFRSRLRLERAWLAEGVRPALLPLLDAWLDVLDVERRVARRTPLLARRERLLLWENLRPDAPDAVDAAHLCAVSDSRRNDQEREAAASDEVRTRSALLAELRSAPDPSLDERFLLAYLTALAVDPRSPTRDADQGPARARFEAIAEDRAAPTILRVLANRWLADNTMATDPSNVRADALERIVDLTDDPRYELAARLDLALQVAGGAPLAKALTALEPAFAAATDPDSRNAYPRLLVSLAEARWKARDVRGAFDAWATCLRAAELTEDDDDDWWGCGANVASSLHELSGVDAASADVEIPDAFAASIGVAVMRTAMDARDRREAVRAGELALARAPDAAHAPLVLALLARLEADPAKRRALLDRRNTRYGTGTAWFQREQRRAYAFGTNDYTLANLFDPVEPPIPAEPTNEDEWRVEIRDDRLPAVRDACRDVLLPESATLKARIDATGAAPRVTVSSTAKAPDSIACLERELAARLRSLPPVEITVTFTM